MRLSRWLLAVLVIGSMARAGFGADTVIPPINERFAKADIAEEPDFQKHVVMLFGRLGCNGRACHGSFQGRGGFRLSLFGYDFGADHAALFDAKSPRVNREKPAESLVIAKPTDADAHEGGERFKLGSWQHRVLLRWIEAGAKFEEKQVQKLVKLDVQPAEVIFQKPGTNVQLKAIAVWEDGSREDVTPLCRFQTNNEQIAKIDENGLLTGNEPGDTFVVAFYDNGVVPVPVMRPVSDLVGSKYPKVPTPTKIDELVIGKLRKLGVVPSDLASDSEFLRRLTLDLTGTLPSAKETAEFVADSAKDKRARKIDELMERPAYAAWWTTRLCDYTGNNDFQLNNVLPQIGRNGTSASQGWYDWIYKRVAENTPYDELAEGIVVGASRKSGQSYTEYCSEMSDLYRPDADKKFADLPSMPLYWARRDLRMAENRTNHFAYAFMGLRIQCAQCHKHPFDQWSKKDFDQFMGFFRQVTVTQNRPRREDQKEYDAIVKELGVDLKGNNNQQRQELTKALADGKTIPFFEVYVEKASRRNGAGPTAKTLGGETIDLSEVEDPRVALMAWLREPNNPYFARSFVNRVWANYFNVGIVQPPDDLSLANPPSNRALLDWLTEQFLANKYDMKWLHRTICNSRTYQLTWKPNETNRLDETNFSHAVPRRLPAEVAYDAVQQATAGDELAAQFCSKLDGRAVAIAGSSSRGLAQGNQNYALTIFGRSTRESGCDCDRAVDASLLQTVYLKNDRDVQTLIDRRGGWIDQITRQLKDKDDKPMAPETLVTQAYLRTLTREPSADEMSRSLRYLEQEPDRANGVRGLLWALINTKEFIVNH